MTFSGKTTCGPLLWAHTYLLPKQLENTPPALHNNTPKHKLYLKNKAHPHKHHPKPNTHLKQETQPYLIYHPLHKIHPNPNFHPNPTPYPHTKPNLHSRYTPYQKYKITLVYRPHHEPSLKHHITNKWKLHINTQHILQDHLHTREKKKEKNFGLRRRPT